MHFSISVHAIEIACRAVSDDVLPMLGERCMLLVCLSFRCWPPNVLENRNETRFRGTGRERDEVQQCVDGRCHRLYCQIHRLAKATQWVQPGRKGWQLRVSEPIDQSRKPGHRELKRKACAYETWQDENPPHQASRQTNLQLPSYRFFPSNLHAI